MSKGNMFLGYARGKVGSVVFSRANGQQITRAKADKVSNPRTDAQLLQRIIINTVASAYSVLSPICDHSFQGKQRGQACMSEFMKKNADKLRALIATNGLSQKTFLALGANGYRTNEYIVSSGTLPEPQVTNNSGTYVIGSALSGNSPTYQDICDALGAKRGDQLTVLAYTGYGANGSMDFHYMRVILDPRETNGSAAAMTTTFLSGGTINKPNPRNEYDEEIELEVANSYLSFTPRIAGGVAVIMSRKANGTWKRSPAVLQVEAATLNNVVNMTMEDAIAASQGSALEMGSDIYLNNATNG